MKPTTIVLMFGLTLLVGGCVSYYPVYVEVPAARVAPLPPVTEVHEVPLPPPDEAPYEAPPADEWDEGDEVARVEVLPPDEEIREESWVEEEYVVPAVIVESGPTYVEVDEGGWVGYDEVVYDDGWGYWNDPWSDVWFGVSIGYWDGDGYRGHRGGHGGHGNHKGGKGHDDHDGHGGNDHGDRDSGDRGGHDVRRTTDRRARVRERENIVRGSRSGGTEPLSSGSRGSLRSYYDRKRTLPAAVSSDSSGRAGTSGVSPRGERSERSETRGRTLGRTASSRVSYSVPNWRPTASSTRSEPAARRAESATADRSDAARSRTRSLGGGRWKDSSSTGDTSSRATSSRGRSTSSRSSTSRTSRTSSTPVSRDRRGSRASTGSASRRTSTGSSSKRASTGFGRSRPSSSSQGSQRSSRGSAGSSSRSSGASRDSRASNRGSGSSRSSSGRSGSRSRSGKWGGNGLKSGR